MYNFLKEFDVLGRSRRLGRCQLPEEAKSGSAPTAFDSSAQTFKERLSPGGGSSDVGGCKATCE